MSEEAKKIIASIEAGILPPLPTGDEKPICGLLQTHYN